jgi:hypothetical protein
MHYVCLENNQIISILNYQPSVPQTVTVVEIADNDFVKIENKTHYFNVISRTVDAIPPEQLIQQQTFNQNNEKREFLNSTDWKILRHLREKALTIDTTMTEQEYLDLENQRQEIAKSITEQRSE